jgi:hypothetical protein
MAPYSVPFAFLASSPTELTTVTCRQENFCKLSADLVGTLSRSLTVRLKQLFSEPLLHFFVLGVALFALFAWKNDDALRSPDDIVVDTMRVDALATQFERVWRRPPTSDELQSLVDNWVREEILYREGLSLGLDRNDPFTRRRIAQKMEFISEELVQTSPDTESLKSWFAENAESYRQDPRVSFRHLYLNPSAHGDDFKAHVEEVGRALESGNVPVGDATLLPLILEDATISEVRRTLGAAFADALQGLSVGKWEGPVTSGYGVHFVRIDTMQASRVPELDEVRATVERDYDVERTGELKEAFIEELRKRYNVVYDDGIQLGDKLLGRERTK